MQKARLVKSGMSRSVRSGVANFASLEIGVFSYIQASKKLTVVLERLADPRAPDLVQNQKVAHI